MTRKTDRRCFLVRGIAGAAVAGAAYSSIEEDILLAAIDEGRAQPTPVDRPKVEISADAMPRGKIGGVSISRLILGGNLNVKTFHSDRYWSASPKEQRDKEGWYGGGTRDNMWCVNPEETAAFMETVEKPWIAFKVMAAGAIPPALAFPYAYRNGSDFVLAGMFDFQIEGDAKITVDAIRTTATRKRPWRG